MYLCSSYYGTQKLALDEHSKEMHTHRRPCWCSGIDAGFFFFFFILLCCYNIIFAIHKNMTEYPMVYGKMLQKS